MLCSSVQDKLCSALVYVVTLTWLMPEVRNSSYFTSYRLFLFGRKMRSIADNFDEEVRSRAGGRRSLGCAVVPQSGAALFMMTMTHGRITEILRRLLGLLNVGSSLVLINCIDLAVSTINNRAIRRHLLVPFN